MKYIEIKSSSLGGLWFKHSTCKNHKESIWSVHIYIVQDLALESLILILDLNY